MPYIVDILVLDQTHTLTMSAITGGIWVPPSSFASSPSTPTFAGTMDPKSGLLTFPALAGPPAGESVMLVSQPPAPGGVASFGDLFRSGTVAAFPASPAFLLGGCQASPAMVQADLDKLTSNFAAQTLEVPNWLFWLVGWLSYGYIFPSTITVLSATLTLGTPGFLTLTLTGTMQVAHFLVWSHTYPWTFTELLSLAPSADPVDTSHILAATYTSPGLSMPGVTGLVIKPLAPFMANQVTPTVETLVNQAIPAAVAAQLASANPPQKLSPTAVISANKISIGASSLTLTLTIADIFGPPIVPIQTTTVPDVLDEELAQARADLRAAHLGIKVLGSRKYVTDQIPKSGEVVPVDTVVTVIMGPSNRSAKQQEPATSNEADETKGA